MPSALIIALLLVGSAASAQTMAGGAISGGGIGASGGGGAEATLYNDPTANIFDTYDPNCDPADKATTGIVWCDGWEDGIWWDLQVNSGCAPSSDPSTCACWGSSVAAGVNDSWSPYSGGSSYWGLEGTWNCESYRLGGSTYRYAHLRPGTVINTTIANYGVAGTPGVASAGWSGVDRSDYQTKGANGTKAVMVENNDPFDLASTGLRHYYVRFYFREVGPESTVCDCNETGGWQCDSTTLPDPVCPAFDQAGPNGYKMIEQNDSWPDFPGIAGWLNGSLNVTSNLDNGINNGSCGSGTNYSTGSPHNVSAFTHHDKRGHWIYWEAEVDESEVGDGSMRIWQDDCGVDGLGCTGTPTLRALHTSISAWGGCDPQGLRAVWLNAWNTAVRGELQVDEMAVADGSVRGNNNPIGHHPNMTGVTVEP